MKITYDSESTARCDVCYRPMDFEDVANFISASMEFEFWRTYQPCPCEQENNEGEGA